MITNIPRYTEDLFLSNLTNIESGRLDEEFARLASFEDKGLWCNPNCHLALIADTLNCKITLLRPIIPNSTGIKWEKEDLTFTPKGN